MIEYIHTFRVLYPDTDRMGTMYHGNYAKYYEVARWELLRSIDLPYSAIEEAGFMCPVTRMNFKFLQTTRYDELLTVRTRLKAVEGMSIWFTYKLYNEKNELINTAETELAFVGLNDWKVCPVPAIFLNAIETYTSNHPQMV
jgi:acyl-CoA thioester hydrolase